MTSKEKIMRALKNALKGGSSTETVDPDKLIKITEYIYGEIERCVKEEDDPRKIAMCIAKIPGLQINLSEIIKQIMEEEMGWGE